MDFQLPELGEGVYEGEVSRWLVEPGQAVKPGQGLLEVLTDKANMEVPSPFRGTVRELSARPGDVIKVGQTVLRYETADGGADAPAENKPTPPAAKTPARRTADNGASPRFSVPVKAAPSVRLLAQQMNIDLAKVRGTGPEGRVLVGDLGAYVQQTPAKPEPKTAFDLGKPGTRVKLQGLRRKIAEHMVQSKQTVPHYTYVDECDVSELVKVREGLKEPFAKAGAKLTFLAFFVKATARALQEVPLVNASLDDEAGEIVMHDRYHIGIAVAAPNGLIVPVIRDADKKSLLEIAQEIDRLSNDARQGKSKLEDLKGGTFTITSIGNLGGLFATPIIPLPQVGILGIGKIVRRPVFDARGQVVPADLIYLSMSFDHRVLDGAIGTAFGNALMEHLRRPLSLAF